jgi:integrase/recombinase XerD
MNSQGIYDLLKKRSEQAGIENCSPHDLRRTFVTRLLESGIDINTVRQLAGHTDIQTTARYDLRDVKAQKKSCSKINI